MAVWTDLVGGHLEWKKIKLLTFSSIIMEPHNQFKKNLNTVTCSQSKLKNINIYTTFKKKVRPS